MLGVNLGSWLVLEQYMVPHIFALVAGSPYGERQLMQARALPLTRMRCDGLGSLRAALREPCCDPGRPERHEGRPSADCNALQDRAHRIRSRWYGTERYATDAVACIARSNLTSRLLSC